MITRTMEPVRTGSRATPWRQTSALLAFALSGFPLLLWYGRRATDGSDEPLGVIALIAALVTVTVAARYGKRARILPARMIVGAGLLAGVQLVGSTLYPLVIGVLAVGVVAFSVSMPRGKAGVIALLILSLPLMASLDFFAGYPLRLAAAEITAKLLQSSGIAVDRIGVLLIDGNGLVGIDPPCAGIRMLWTANFVAAVLAARMRFSWLRTLGLMSLATAFVVIGNGIRAAIVFLPESGRVDWPEWAHPLAGLLVHGCVLAAVFSVANRLEELDERHRDRRPWAGLRQVTVCGVVLAGLFGVVLAIDLSRGNPPLSSRSVAWPTMLDGIALDPMDLSPMEKRFARSFPGEIAKFRWDEAEVIIRKTDRATRMMHPSGDCLRAAGFEIHSEPVFRDRDERLWGASVARRDGRRWLVHERYVSATGEACTDASAWYWQALLQPDLGPWTAVTVIRAEH